MKRITREMVERWNERVRAVSVSSWVGRIRSESVPDAGWTVVELLRSDAEWMDIVGLLAVNDVLENDALAAYLIHVWHVRAEARVRDSEFREDEPWNTMRQMLGDLDMALDMLDIKAAFQPTSYIAYLYGGRSDAAMEREWDLQRAEFLAAVALREESACAAPGPPAILEACKP